MTSRPTAVEWTNATEEDLKSNFAEVRGPRVTAMPWLREARVKQSTVLFPISTWAKAMREPERTVRRWCSEGLIPGAIQKGRNWKAYYPTADRIAECAGRLKRAGRSPRPGVKEKTELGLFEAIDGALSHHQREGDLYAASLEGVVREIRQVLSETGTGKNKRRIPIESPQWRIRQDMVAVDAMARCHFKRKLFRAGKIEENLRFLGAGSPETRRVASYFAKNQALENAKSAEQRGQLSLAIRSLTGTQKATVGNLAKWFGISRTTFRKRFPRYKEIVATVGVSGNTPPGHDEPRQNISKPKRN